MNPTDRVSLQRAVIIAGPTSSGKSALALEWARQQGGEIVCADAFQLYREFPVLSARPAPEETAEISHHLFGVVPCEESIDAARYAEMALEAVREITKRGRVPFIVGGSGLYLQALVAGLPDLPAIAPEIREEVRRMSPDEMVRLLGRIDPRSLDAIDLRNPRRVARRLEISMQTGRPASEALTPRAPVEGLRGIVLTRPREVLHARIGRAVSARLAHGAIEEVRRVRAVAGPTARQILGWREIITHLDGNISLDECRELLTVATRRYAKRQLTWFRTKLPLPQMELPADPVGFPPCPW